MLKRSARKRKKNKEREKALEKESLVNAWDKRQKRIELQPNGVRVERFRNGRTRPLIEEYQNGTSIAETPEFAYALGHIEAWVETYCKSANLSYESFTAQLGKVLSSKARG